MLTYADVCRHALIGSVEVQLELADMSAGVPPKWYRLANANAAKDAPEFAGEVLLSVVPVHDRERGNAGQLPTASEQGI